MTFVKNLAVSFLWGACVFVVPILYSPIPVIQSSCMMLLPGIGLFLSTLNNTLFDDILDEDGDRVAGIRTLPTVWGARNSYAHPLVPGRGLDRLGRRPLLLAGRLDAGHAAFLLPGRLSRSLYMGLMPSGSAQGMVDFAGGIGSAVLRRGVDAAEPGSDAAAAGSGREAVSRLGGQGVHLPFAHAGCAARGFADQPRDHVLLRKDLGPVAAAVIEDVEVPLMMGDQA